MRKIKVCKVLQENRLINWSHQQFIDIPTFHSKKGIAYKYSIPCWEYGTNTPILKGNYIIKKNILTIKVTAKIVTSDFNIDVEILTAGYRDNRDYKCVIDIEKPYQKKKKLNKKDVIYKHNILE